MSSLRRAFSSKRKTILMVLIHHLNFLMYWTISIRTLVLQSISSCINPSLLQVHLLRGGSIESNGATSESEETHPSLAAVDQRRPWWSSWIQGAPYDNFLAGSVNLIRFLSY